MTGAVDFFGLYLPWLMPLAAVALLALALVRRVLAWTGAYRWIWHPALFDMALYVVLLWGLSAASLRVLHPG
ncbi:DUF1656 domain-containing protein [Roseateles chitosanitabidus]|jgi:protein-S-isoprenylcysteine O-methyltransferase Ste14|uniref:DUF1656 domain-containing protein n=1 Tax=Roseateles chitosanitabidus TaxID=65048 RepID=UPI00082D884A|nr:DUF1656 domain-containing protein [Roseateles chitosanitabidus]MBO9689896.1 DUF1656 domain-containing protein [Roseateles chitosanitabidus]